MNIQFIKLQEKLRFHAALTILYISPKNELWGIYGCGEKVCVIKRLNHMINLHYELIRPFIQLRRLISYEDSLLFRDGQVCIFSSDYYIELIDTATDAETRIWLLNSDDIRDLGHYYGEKEPKIIF